MYNIRDPNPTRRAVPIIRLQYFGPARLVGPKTDAIIRRHITRCLRRLPTGGEGIKWISGVECWFSFMVLDNGEVEVNFVEREFAEDTLNQGGLSTYEPGSPYPRHKAN